MKFIRKQNNILKRMSKKELLEENMAVEIFINCAAGYQQKVKELLFKKLK